MEQKDTAFATKLRWNLPWLARYPWVRLRSLLEQTAFEHKHVIITVANHFEPGWSESGVLDHATQMRRLEDHHRLARITGDAVRDADGTKFRHTNFYPAEQYHAAILDRLAEMQAEGLGEVEVHLHHGVERPDTPGDLRRQLVDFRDILAARHKCLSKMPGDEMPRYAFVHGNLALANSCGGRFCGVDSEMQILQETGCYADMTLPSAPDRSQVAVINSIYQCGLPLDQPVPHRTGTRVTVGSNHLKLPLIFTGPLVFNWAGTPNGVPRPRIDDGALTANQPLNARRLRRWMSANVTVDGKSDWIFVKLYCHGFFDRDRSACIGEEARRFFGEMVERGERTGKYTVHFATAREAFNMAAAAVDRKTGSPNDWRNYKLQAIMEAVAH